MDLRTVRVYSDPALAIWLIVGLKPTLVSMGGMIGMAFMVNSSHPRQTSMAAIDRSAELISDKSKINMLGASPKHWEPNQVQYEYANTLLLKCKLVQFTPSGTTSSLLDTLVNFKSQS